MAKPLAWTAVVITFLWACAVPGLESLAALITSLVAVAGVHATMRKHTALAEQASNQHTETPLQHEITEIVERSPVFGLADRFIEVFVSHGVHINEIPRCFPDDIEITHADLSSQEKIIAMLSREVIDWVCRTFGIRRDWLEADDDYKYSTEDYYKNMRSLIKLLRDLKAQHFHGIRVIAYKNVDELDSSSERNQHVMLLIVVPAINFEDKTVHRYIPIRTFWNWGYWRTRYEFKAITRVCYKELSIPFDGYDLDLETMTQLAEGSVFPKTIIDQTSGGFTWFPDDYTEKASVSQCAKETYETNAIIDYIREQSLAPSQSKGRQM